MQIKKITSGLAQENGYVLEKDGTVIVIDPGTDDPRYFEVIEHFGKPSAILLTHAHFDHIGGIDALRERYQIPVYVHRFETSWLTDGEKNGAAAFNLPVPAMKPAEKTYEGDMLVVGSIAFRLYHTPGHSPGSVVLYMKDEEVAFCGDLIFKQSVGRTDLFGGDQKALMGSIDRMKQLLPDSTVLYSGHGPRTTLEDEKRTNPFFKQ
ncbi:MBL fold metallo-hydrolase [Exiguobacterium marinum]|uniref:MBL fold metallo-hydrolase n=1 Tax=Exiguobacterium marinum TaxID=273528 RepID=UPI00047BFBFA|nr:MBL fold metallo-hydrolase [Exiguobacterium marinum]